MHQFSGLFKLLTVLSLILKTTRFETAAEDLLEFQNVVNVYDRKMFPGNVSVRGRATAEVIPRLELLVQPISLASAAEGDGVENIDSSCTWVSVREYNCRNEGTHRLSQTGCTPCRT